MKMHSQNKEEEVILNYFGSRVGTFLSLGENDGVTFSNVRALALRGWKGVMVEPSPKAYERLKTLYNGHKGFYIYPFAISNYNGKAMLQESGPLCSASDVGLVSTFHAAEMDRFKRTVSYDSVEVKTFTWKTFLNRLKIKEFTMISIDIESHEMAVLPDMDLSKTELLVIEHNSSEEKKKAYLECTSKYGMNKIIYESAENLIIVR
jgi:FkbM family methyltransferase